ncbi:response regulator transcription factor [Lewinella cohaerens]|uniref:response regulator transcription factor n=1 Tax=Lewinella cohaerens TaxID=70995 RepID=UPI00036D61F5|nr:response regulator transcription factor [Lewinella cohaerens]
MNKPIKIIITDDQNLFREGLSMILAKDPEIDIIGEAVNGRDLLDKLPTLQPDVILLDYTMPELDGFETFQVIQQQYPLIKVLILTMHYDESLMVFLMEKGVHGYLLKDEESEVVISAIKTVHEDGQYYSDYVSKAILSHLRAAKTTNNSRRQAQQTNNFSQREIEVLEIIGQGNRREIAERLFISIKTVDFHLKNLREKTDCSNTAALIKFALKNGYQQ